VNYQVKLHMLKAELMWPSRAKHIEGRAHVTWTIKPN